MRCAPRGCREPDIDSLYLLIPLSVVLVLAIGALLAWAVLGGQFDDLDAEGRRVLDDDPPPDHGPREQ